MSFHSQSAALHRIGSRSRVMQKRRLADIMLNDVYGVLFIVYNQAIDHMAVMVNSVV
jgi:hypothetical protein